MAVEQVARWRSEVSSFAPDRLEEFDELIADALNNPGAGATLGRVRAEPAAPRPVRSPSSPPRSRPAGNVSVSEPAV